MVEDSVACRESLTLVLRADGHTVIAVCHGQEALDYLDGNPAPELILLDMLRPVMDGWNFLKRLSFPIPVIITTGTILTPECARSYGCAGFLRKPISREELLAEVHRWLG